MDVDINKRCEIAKKKTSENNFIVNLNSPVLRQLIELNTLAD